MRRHDGSKWHAYRPLESRYSLKHYELIECIDLPLQLDSVYKINRHRYSLFV
jgi:hypothetical protein